MKFDLGIEIGSPEEELPPEVLHEGEAAVDEEEFTVTEEDADAAVRVDEVDFSALNLKSEGGEWIPYDVTYDAGGLPQVLELELQVFPLSSREAQTYYALLLQRWLNSQPKWAEFVKNHPKGFASLPLEVHTRCQFYTLAHKCLGGWRGRRSKGPGLTGFPSDVKENRERFLNEFPGAFSTVMNAARGDGTSFIELRAADALGNSSSGSNGSTPESEPQDESAEADA